MAFLDSIRGKDPAAEYRSGLAQSQSSHAQRHLEVAAVLAVMIDDEGHNPMTYLSPLTSQEVDIIEDDGQSSSINLDDDF